MTITATKIQSFLHENKVWNRMHIYFSLDEFEYFALLFIHSQIITMNKLARYSCECVRFLLCAQLSMVESTSQLIIISTHFLFVAFYNSHLCSPRWLPHSFNYSSFISLIGIVGYVSLSLTHFELILHIHVSFKNEHRKTQNTSLPSIREKYTHQSSFIQVWMDKSQRNTNYADWIKFNCMAEEAK